MTTTHDKWLYDAVQARRAIRVPFGAELDNAAMNRALRAAAGRLPPEKDDGEPDATRVASAPQGSADGGARQQPAPEPNPNARMNTLLRRRRVTDASGTVGYYDRSTGVFTPNP